VTQLRRQLEHSPPQKLQTLHSFTQLVLWLPL